MALQRFIMATSYSKANCNLRRFGSVLRTCMNSSRGSWLLRQSSNRAPRIQPPLRPTISSLQLKLVPFHASPSIGRRWMFIQTEDTPNINALKFKPNQRVLPENLSVPFLEYLSPRSTVAPPYPSPLASQLLGVDGVSSVFYGTDYITVTKDSSALWTHIKPEVFSLITEVVSSGQPVVKSVVSSSAEEAYNNEAAMSSEDYDESDADVVAMIKELLETRVRPAIQEDGGDIEFRGFKDGKVMLKLRGACRTCDSSTITLRNGIENMLQFYIPEVKGIQQVLDQEEEVALKEFEKFEEKLRLRKNAESIKSSES